MLYHVSGEFAIRWMTAVLTCTPFFILFGISNLFVRQAMGIATAVWSLLHFIIFIAAEGFLETFTQVNYIAGFIAILILIPLLFTSNRKSMKRLKKNWKKLQSYSYAAILLTLIHVAILDKTWIIYAVIVGLGFILRIPFVKNKVIKFRS
ncbi:ferric reductase-like transmembrane domain-containing protein [Lacinutrix sp. MEBiC02595]